jgi:hypothetical protein
MNDPCIFSQKRQLIQEKEVQYPSNHQLGMKCVKYVLMSRYFCGYALL